MGDTCNIAYFTTMEGPTTVTKMRYVPDIRIDDVRATDELHFPNGWGMNAAVAREGRFIGWAAMEGPMREPRVL